MRIRYLVDSENVPSAGRSIFYVPRGVWAQDRDNPSDLTMAYLEPDSAFATEAELIITRIAEAGLAIPDDFLDQWAEWTPIYSADRGAIFETSNYDNTAQCADAILNIITTNYDQLTNTWKIPFVELI